MILDKARAAQDLNRVDGGRLRDLESLALRRLGVPHQRLKFGIAIPLSGRTPGIQASRVKLHRHLRHYKGDALVRGDGPTKGDTLPGVVHGILEGRARHTAGNARAQYAVERSRAYYAAIARLAQHTACRYGRVVEVKRRARHSDQSKFVRIMLDEQALSLSRNH